MVLVGQNLTCRIVISTVHVFKFQGTWEPPCRNAVNVKFYVYPNLVLIFSSYLSGFGVADGVAKTILPLKPIFIFLPIGPENS